MEDEFKIGVGDSDLALLLPRVVEFTTKSGSLLAKNLNEVVGATSEGGGVGAVVFMQLRDDNCVGYVCGYFTCPGEFIISQALLPNPEFSQHYFSEVERELKKRGAQKLMLLTPHNPRLYRRYGFKFDRFLLVKEVGHNGIE